MVEWLNGWEGGGSGDKRWNGFIRLRMRNAHVGLALAPCRGHKASALRQAQGRPFDIVGPASRDSGSWCVYQVVSGMTLDEQDTGTPLRGDAHPTPREPMASPNNLSPSHREVIHTRPGYRAQETKSAKGAEGMDKRWNGGMVEWWNGGIVEWIRGGMVSFG